ncbi:MAG TPA: hypothetical protein VKS21_12440 [Spirochaetota bacterium]|nr:hypothetical protein [Spirochaetota bacterium]
MITSDIKEPALLKIQSISDDRGVLIPYTDDIDDNLFKRAYIVENYGRGVIRGLHYHRQEIKIFIVPAGAAKFITMKLPLEMAERNDEEQIKKYLQQNPDILKSWTLSSRHYAVLAVPPLYANGWVGLKDNTLLFSLSSLRFEKAKDDDIRIDPYLIGKDKWEVIGR